MKGGGSHTYCTVYTVTVQCTVYAVQLLYTVHCTMYTRTHSVYTQHLHMCCLTLQTRTRTHYAVFTLKTMQCTVVCSVSVSDGGALTLQGLAVFLAV